MLYVLKNLINKHFHPNKIKVVSACFSAAMHSVLVTDKRGVAMGNIMPWGRQPGEERSKAIKESKDAKFMYTARGNTHPADFVLI